MLVTELGIVTDVKYTLARNALSPILVTEFSIITVLHVGSNLNPPVWTLVTEPEPVIITVTKLANAGSGKLINDVGIDIVVKFVHELNAFTPILVTEFGIVNVVNIDCQKTQAPILVTVFGIVIEFREGQL
jgi:hypothetical protein